MINADDVFNPKDFESIRLDVHFQNFTTGTEVKDHKKASLVELGDKWLVFELPAKSCAAKHNVCADIGRVTHRKDKNKKDVIDPILKVTGKVHGVEELDDGRMRVIVECLQFDEQSWGNLMDLFSSRQSEIEKFFQAVKG